MSDSPEIASVTENKTPFRFQMVTEFPPLENKLTHLQIESITTIKVASWHRSSVELVHRVY